MFSNRFPPSMPLLLSRHTSYAIHLLLLAGSLLCRPSCRRLPHLFPTRSFQFNVSLPRSLDTRMFLLHVHLSRSFCQLCRPFLGSFLSFFFFNPLSIPYVFFPRPIRLSIFSFYFIQRSEADGVRELLYRLVRILQGTSCSALERRKSVKSWWSGSMLFQ